ncbi:2,3-diaminopropionate biosynthesis protein SbnB [Saccharothrix violaceirubra]|uniref:Ornithine cyclodeaminase n=1 Tax=Saccharothrix violaceirubra TaxID=413306 RepID=A0A7W7T6K7_9PSEU|nr:2,3-diaminopropionate biosynthesis protein SbnB [Saccharothrix violaceirubra]MBB4967286.1 ornithine cyclodeaminase [Saccharothrix violaceirubra]
MLILTHDEVAGVLRDREAELIELVAAAYRLHDEGRSAVPHSTFLRFPDDDRNRIIGLPAFLGGDRPSAGMKWIASFPGNLEKGLERASSVIVLNELDTGRPIALLESSLISAKRTAASAALAAREFGPAGLSGAGFVGCGPINLEVLRFLLVAVPTLAEITLFDLSPARAEAFAAKARELSPTLKVAIATDLDDAVGAHDALSLATTAGTPHMDLSKARPGATVLHVSLRDLTVETILGAQNIVDDADHVCRERTSLHLAEQHTGGRDFVDGPIGGVLRGRVAFTRDTTRPLVYSPFGLGALDMAVAEFVNAEAAARGLGTTVAGFLPGTTS